MNDHWTNEGETTPLLCKCTIGIKFVSKGHGRYMSGTCQDMEGAWAVSGHLAQEYELGLDVVWQRARNAHYRLIKLVTLLWDPRNGSLSAIQACVQSRSVAWCDDAVLSLMKEIATGVWRGGFRRGGGFEIGRAMTRLWVSEGKQDGWWYNDTWILY